VTAAHLLHPGVLATIPVVTAHGDDHQGNVGGLGAGHGVRVSGLALVMAVISWSRYV
jgi:hypothetical protein